VYALYDADHKWYRGRVEDIKSSRVSLLVLLVYCLMWCTVTKICSINVLYDFVFSQVDME